LGGGCVGLRAVGLLGAPDSFLGLVGFWSVGGGRAIVVSILPVVPE